MLRRKSDKQSRCRGPNRPGRALAALILAFAASLSYADDGLIGERPNEGGPADEVTVRLALLDIDSVEDRTQRFNIDAFYEITWRDPRLADHASASEGRVLTFGIDEIWTPSLTIVNNRGLTHMLPQVASVDPDGLVTIRQRSSGALAVDLDLHRFPFDTQRLSMNIVSYRYDPSEMVFSADSELIAPTGQYSADGWNFTALEPEFSVFRLADGGRGSSQLRFTVEAERISDFFILTLALPMTLILFMAWTVHWLQPDIIPARIGMSTATVFYALGTLTTVFSLIALGVSYRLSLPRIDYLTRADHFVIYSTLVLLVSLGITVLATRWHDSGREAAASKLALYTRWAFPLVAIAIVALTLRP